MKAANCQQLLVIQDSIGFYYVCKKHHTGDDGGEQVGKCSETSTIYCQECKDEKRQKNVIERRVRSRKSLTSKEKELLCYLQVSDKEIAKALHCQLCTIHKRMENIFYILEVKTRIEALVKALKQNLITPELIQDELK